MKKIMKIFKSICSFLSRIIDKIIVVPISKFVLWINTKFDKPSKWFENWLSKTNTLLFISLLVAVLTFVVIDQKILTYSESSAEVLSNQPVKVLYDEDNYVVEGVPEDVDITLIGSKADLYIAKQSSLANDVTLNLWGLKPGTHKVDLKYNQASGSLKYSVNPSVATVIIYEKVSSLKTLAIDLLNQDALDEKYIIDDVSTTTDSVTIQGASYKVSQVATVKALVDVNSLPKFELGETIKVSSTLKAYDESGNVVDVEISPAKADVEITISSPSKVVPLQVVTNGSVIYNMGISNLTINNNEKTNVTIYGTEEVLSTIDFIPVNINVEGLTESTQFKVELEKPTGVKYMDLTTATVDVMLSSDITNVDINDVSINVENKGSNYGAKPVDFDSITVKVKGVSDVVNNITASDIRAYVDLAGKGVGTHEVDIMVEVNDPRVECLPSVLKMKVTIYEK